MQNWNTRIVFDPIYLFCNNTEALNPQESHL